MLSQCNFIRHYSARLIQWKTIDRGNLPITCSRTECSLKVNNSHLVISTFEVQHIRYRLRTHLHIDHRWRLGHRPGTLAKRWVYSTWRCRQYLKVTYGWKRTVRTTTQISQRGNRVGDKHWMSSAYSSRATSSSDYHWSRLVSSLTSSRSSF